MPSDPRRSLRRELAHQIARLRTAELRSRFDDDRLARLAEDLSRYLGRLEGRRDDSTTRESAADSWINGLAWVITVGSSLIGFVDVLRTGQVRTLAGLSLAFAVGGLVVGLLSERRKGQRLRARNRDLQELRRELRVLTIALARVRAARSLRRPAPIGTRREPSTP